MVYNKYISPGENNVERPIMSKDDQTPGLEKIEGTLASSPRKVLTVTIHEGDDEAVAQDKALAEHVARHPEDAGHTVKDFGWIVWEIVHPKFIIGADGCVRWPTVH